MRKTNSFKKAIALFISVLMVISSLPFTAITASAATDPHLIAHFFNNAVPQKSVTKNYGAGADLSAVSEDTLVWNYEENAAEFKGNKSEIALVTFKNLLNNSQADFNNANGLTITFDAKATGNSWQRFFELSTGEPYKGGSVNYLYAATNGYCRAKNMSTGDSETGGDYKMFTVTPNEWHSYKIVIGQGKLFTFVDGKLTNSIDDSSRINDTFFNNLYNDGHLMLGASSWDDPAFVGYIRNFMVVDMATLDIAMAAYEAKMNGTVYTNMKPAYNAYVTAKKCAEALRYGDFESYPNPENIAKTLTDATNAMQPWTAYTGHANETVSSGAFSINDDANDQRYNDTFDNILYTNKGIDSNPVLTTSEYSWGGIKKNTLFDKNYYEVFGKMRFYMPNDITVLYDGNTAPKFGVMINFYDCRINRSSTSEYRFYNARFTSDFDLEQKWHGTDTRANFPFIRFSKGEVDARGHDTSNNWHSNCNGQLYANLATYNNADFSEMVKEVTPGLKVRNGFDLTNVENSFSPNVTIRILNYKKVVDTINAKKSILSGVASYTQGGLTQVMNGFDLATKDPNSYFTSSNNYQSCKTNFEAAISDLGATQTQDTFYTVTAKNGDTTIATFSLSKGCNAKTVECALGMVTPGNGQTETTHYDYTWPKAEAVTANKTYTVTRVDNPHEFKDVDEQTPATCETAGVMNTKCSVCDYASTREIKATGHSYGTFSKDWTEYDENETTYTHSKECNKTDCETPKVTDNCSFGEWVVSQDNTTETRECSVCHGVQTREHVVGKVTVNFKLPNGKVVDSVTVDPETEVTAPSLDAEAFNDADGHHSFYWESASYVITEDTNITAIANKVETHTTATRNINLQNVTEDLVATSCAENLTYSYDIQTYCTECDFIISTVATPVQALAHTQAIRNKDSDVHTVYCSVCLKVIEDVAHNNFSSVTTDPTCTAQGYTTYTCPCGYSYVADYTDMIPHTFGGYTTVNDIHSRICSVCSYEDKGSCVKDRQIVPATCTEDGKLAYVCSVCNHASAPESVVGVELEKFTDVINQADGSRFDSKNFDGNKVGNHRYIYWRGNFGVKNYTLNFPFEVDKVELRIYCHTHENDGSWINVLDDDGRLLQRFNKDSGTGSARDITVRATNTNFIQFNTELKSTQDFLVVDSVVVWPKGYSKLGHDYVKNDDFGNGLLGTHTCSRCNETLEHNLDLNRVNSTIVASCKDCDFSEVLHTTANTVTVTENNLFDTDKFFQSYTADGTNKTSKGLACFRRTDGKAVVVGNGDNYTSHDRDNDYLIPVEGGKTYQFDFDASTTYGDVMLFFRGAGNGYDGNYLNMRKSGTAIGKNTIEFTVPEGGKQLYIRVGTNSGDRNAYCVFSNFALHEKDDPNYRMITNVPSGSAINDVLDQINQHATADFCCYKFTNSSISFADGTLANGKTINRNVNVVAQKEHNLYKEFRNGTVAHYYCLDCGYATDKYAVAPSLIYRESFDNVTINGKTMTSPTGVNGTLYNEGSVSVVAGAGDTHGNKSSGGAYNGSASEWRTNVLKINKPSTLNNSRGNYIKMTSNPFTNSTAKANAKQNGVTISFWRHLENEDGSLGQVNTKNASEAQWRDIITFMPSSAQSTFDNGASTSQYLMINADGCMSITAPGHTGNDNGAYFDYYPAFNDKTSTMATTTSGYWEHIAVTADPISGVTVYINGVPHDATIKSVNNMGAAYYKNGNVNDGDVAKAIVDWVTSDDMVYSLANGNYWNTSDMVTYIDDIRFYDGAMTQLEVNQMYGDSNSDTPVKTSTSHDPTTVIVYTLSNGKTVGQEYIDYYDAASDVVDVWYYSFGTGMTVYKSHDNINWELVGDKKGNFGYQNQDLFGGDYLTVLAEYEKFVKDNMSGQAGAGYLVWAPHVMYNLELDRWTYYAACSVWGGAVAVQFMMSSTDGNIEHYNPSTLTKVKQSYNIRPNVIDACVFYEYDKDTNKPIKDSLWITYGAWCDSDNTKDIMIDKLDADGTINSSTGSAYDKRLWNDQGGQAIVNGLTTTKNEHTGEGSFVRYENGYYYIYVAYGTNEGDYTTRVFRSETPNGEYVDVTGRKALVTSNDKGLQVMNSYYLPAEDYMYVSTGHNSIYTAVNNNGENVTINTLHARPYVNDTTGWNAIPEQAMVTRQTGLTGNVTLINPVFYTQENWPVIMPLQYNGTDTSTVTLTATDIVGKYYYNVMTDSVDYNVSNPQQLEITACIESEAFITFADGTVQKVNIINENGKTYFANDDIKGVFAKQGDTVEFSFISGNHQTWGYQTASGTVSHVYGEYTVTTPATCLANAIEEAKCSKCNGTDSREVANSKLEHSYTGESVHTDADGDANGYTEHRCVNGCNELGGLVYDTVDWAAYDSAVDVANANKAETKKYTAESITAYSKEVAKYTDGVTSGDETKSQAFIDRMTGGIQSATRLLQLKGYDVNFKVEYNNEVLESSTYGNVPFGTVKQFAYTPADGKYIVKWTAEDEKDDKKRVSTIATGSDTASHAIYSDTTIIVYLSDTETTAQDTYSVTLIDKNDKVIGLATVPTSDEVVIGTNGNELLFNENVAMSVPKYPYYQVTGFINADTNKSVVGETVNSNIRIKAVYSVISQINITSAQPVTINETKSAPYTAFFDEKIVAFAKDATAWYANGDLVAYGETYTFQASTSVELSYTTDSVSTSDASSRIDFAQFDTDVNAFRIVVSNCVPENAVIVEQGVKILTSSSTTATVTSDKVINGTKKYVATKTTGTGKQFMYTIAVNNNINTMAIVSFVTYTVDGGEPITVWSSEGATTATMVRR